LKVIVLGAPSSGKTELSLALQHFLVEHDIPLEIVDNPGIESIKKEDITLLCGLDLSGSSETQSSLDQEIRASLQKQGVSFQVVYGQGLQRLQNALFCLASQAPPWAHAFKRSDIAERWKGACQTCGDGACEHQLFSKLIASSK
jgi:hypothetical protein